ncbi:MAG: hypothetical protein ACK52I_01735 [Pseudomonadota bacterium]|jgi:hypothetical protein
MNAKQRRKQRRAFESRDVRCPKCGAMTDCGYGFAFGPGIGSYTFCVRSACGWSEKVLDDDSDGTEKCDFFDAILLGEQKARTAVVVDNEGGAG